MAGQGVGRAGLVAPVEELGEGVPGRSPEPASGMVRGSAGPRRFRRVVVGGAGGGGRGNRTSRASQHAIVLRLQSNWSPECRQRHKQCWRRHATH